MVDCGNQPKAECPMERFEFFLLDKYGAPLLTSVDQKINAYYFDKGIKTDLTTECRDGCKMIRQADNIQYGLYYYSTINAPQGSARLGIKEYYIEMNNDIDTLHLETSLSSHDCAVITAALFNGNQAIDRLRTPTTQYTDAFVFKKK
jgi:hypothetical protein